jgi:hypothetical protein
VTLPQFETLVRAIVGARCSQVAAGARPLQRASPRAPCHFTAPPFTAHWRTRALPEGQHRAVPAVGMVGEYEMQGGKSVKVTLEDGHLHVQPTGEAKRQLAYVSGTRFGVGRADAAITVTFTTEPNGRASSMVWLENGNERTLKRVR